MNVGLPQDEDMTSRHTPGRRLVRGRPDAPLAVSPQATGGPWAPSDLTGRDLERVGRDIEACGDHRHQRNMTAGNDVVPAGHQNPSRVGERLRRAAHDWVLPEARLPIWGLCGRAFSFDRSSTA